MKVPMRASFREGVEMWADVATLASHGRVQAGSGAGRGLRGLRGLGVFPNWTVADYGIAPRPGGDGGTRTTGDGSRSGTEQVQTAGEWDSGQDSGQSSASIIEEAERRARELGIDLTCKEEAVWFPDMMGGQQFYINRVCAAPGTGYNFNADTIAMYGAEQLKRDLQDPWHKEPVQVVQIDPALNYQPLQPSSPTSAANKPNQSVLSTQPGVVQTPKEQTAGDAIKNGLADQADKEQAGFMSMFADSGNFALLAVAGLAVLILMKGGK